MTVIGRSAHELDTPALLIDSDLMTANLSCMAKHARESGVALRPHTKTHKSPAIAHLQLDGGAKGVTVAKLGEAEVMAAAGIKDIFIATPIIGAKKMARLAELHDQIRVATAIDSVAQAHHASQAFAHCEKPLEVLIEVDTGQRRCGVPPGKEAVRLVHTIDQLPGLRFRGIFTHEGHTYYGATRVEAAAMCVGAQREMLHTAEMLREAGLILEEVSIGCTPAILAGAEILRGITEIRPGTYVFYDRAQAGVVSTFDHCAATILATVISRPVAGRAVLDSGSKALTSDKRGTGVCQTHPGYGVLKHNTKLYLDRLSDEHGVLDAGLDTDQAGWIDRLQVGDKVEVIPNHICPVVNLFDVMHVVRNGRIEAIWSVAARGKSQ